MTPSHCFNSSDLILPHIRLGRNLASQSQEFSAFWLARLWATERTWILGREASCYCRCTSLLLSKYHTLYDVCFVRKFLQITTPDHKYLSLFLCLIKSCNVKRVFTVAYASIRSARSQNLTKPLLRSLLNQTFSLGTPIHWQVSSED